MKSCRIKPVLNQIESHLYFNNQKLNLFCQKLNIPLMAFHPIGETRVKRDDRHLRDDPQLSKLASQLETSPVKLLLRFHIERGIIPIPKSSNSIHIRENFEALSMQPLGEEVMNKLLSFDCNLRFYSHKWIAKLSKFYPFNDEV
ncbi:Oidioi.mRNA.OKI2018_I69.XSR.g15479.t1.cds [Oikopleura dioica]|uniref:Oidioi.mRNA.OKI2018_I69.XSR.g15479.t1.cds n=1 Tax=Oikopleura dioica TaxID=34765 RepID=A0ABN7SH19_OIKDI|nr:Oidioi.mRNA.OKI2018_I69.XSR.g15479.t1.cds [Oikopleura dioica]